MTQVTREQLATLPADVQAYIAGLAAKASAASASRVSFKVTAQKTDEKTGKVTGRNGAISMYGLGQFPTTLYVSQWERIIEAVKSGALERFIEANEALLSRKA